MNTFSPNFIQKDAKKRCACMRGSQEGQVVMVIVMSFLVISLVVIFGIVLPITAQLKNSAAVLQTRRSMLAADVLNDDALYRLNVGRTLPGTIVLSMNQATATAQINTIIGGKEVVVLGESGATDRYSRSRYVQGSDLSLTYGAVTGIGGLQMSGGPTIYGNVFANGNVTAEGGSTVTGSVVSAPVTENDADVENLELTSTPWGGQTVGTATGVQTMAQSFTVSTTTAVTSFDFYVRKAGVPANATVKIFNNNGGNVGSTQIGSSASLSASSVGTIYGWTKVYMYSPVSLTPGTTYWMTVEYAGTATSYYTFAMNNNAYANGSMKLKNKSGGYTNPITTTSDAYFKIFTGGVSLISGININGSATAGIINNSNVAGSLYCQSGSNNNYGGKNCDTSQPIPSALPFPVTDAMVQAWKDEASLGTIRNASWTLGGATATSTGGPMRINGNLTVGEGATLTIAGPLYVTGNFIVQGGAKVVLASSYGSADEVIVANRFKLSGGGQLTGSGQIGSYLTLVAAGTNCTVSCDGLTNAGHIEGGAGSLLLIVPYGTLNFTGGAAAKAALAYKIVMDGGTTLTYESGLTNVTFGNAAAGAWSVQSWKESAQ